MFLRLPRALRQQGPPRLRPPPCLRAKRHPLESKPMTGHECFHCKQWLEKGAEHDCRTTPEHALTQDPSEDLRDAYERIRETAVEFGDQRIYASHHSIMFA